MLLNHNPFSDDDDAGGTIFRDVILLALAGFMTIVLLLLPHINPPLNSESSKSNPPGNVVVEIKWPSKIDADVDLWVQAPGDMPVGYSNKSGLVFNLLRDDLGNFLDPLDLNYENAYSRGIIPGEYTVNVHAYRNAGNIYPIPVTVVISVKKTKQSNLRPLLKSKVKLIYTGQELTVFRFKLTKDGELVNGSISTIYKPLRSANSGVN